MAVNLSKKPLNGQCFNEDICAMDKREDLNNELLLKCGYVKGTLPIQNIVCEESCENIDSIDNSDVFRLPRTFYTKCEDGVYRMMYDEKDVYEILKQYETFLKNKKPKRAKLNADNYMVLLLILGTIILANFVIGMLAFVLR